MKMTSLLFTLVAIMGFSLIGISLLGINNMKTLSGDMNNLYNERMLPSLELKLIETEFYKIRLSLAQMVYSNNYDSTLRTEYRQTKAKYRQFI
ncbi:MCP four helix bundle domain-containing protein [Caloramator sp. mosi_1]|nr:MCP four helix bundle domain-containing protein [Caloramator sp. mosi_1]WDC85598.1 MCP four helix bundle domain-containing protein [Caloramator sp. mosi_1]